MKPKKKKLIATLMTVSSIAAASAAGYLLYRYFSLTDNNLLKEINDLSLVVVNDYDNLKKDISNRDYLNHAKETYTKANNLLGKNKNIKDETIRNALDILSQNMERLKNLIDESDKILNPKKDEVLKLLDLLSDTNQKKEEIRAIINNPDASSSDLKRATDLIKEALAEAKRQVEEKLNLLSDGETKDDFANKLNKDGLSEQEYIDISNQIDQYLNNKKTDALAQINKLKDNTEKKNNLIKQLEQKDLSESNIKHIKDEAKKVLDDIKKEALPEVNKILEGSEKLKDIVDLINNENANQTDIENAVNKAHDIINNFKKDINNEIDQQLSDEKIKESLKNQVEKASSVGQVLIVEEKLKLALKLDDLIDQDKKQELYDKISQLPIDDPLIKNKLKDLASQIDDVKNNQYDEQLDHLVDQIKKLPYPGGEQATAISELVKKVSEIRSDASLSKQEQYELAKVRIGQDLPTFILKINEAKEKIKKLSPDSGKTANEQLDATFLLNRDINYPNRSFPELDEALNNLLSRDKDNIKHLIEGAGNQKLSFEEIDKLKKLVDDPKTDSYMKMLDIVEQTKILVEKKGLEEKARAINYPGGPSSTAVTELIRQIYTEDENKIDSKEKVEAFKKKLDELSNKVDEAIDAINNVAVDKQTALQDKLNKAYEITDVEKIINEAKNEKQVDDLKQLKSLLDGIVDSLPYPDSNASAKTEIKNLYKDSTDLSFINELKNKITDPNTGLAKKINDAKGKIEKLPKDKQEQLNNLLNSANTDEEFSNLDTAIKNALSKNKDDKKKVIDGLTGLTTEQQNELKTEIDNALTSDEIDRIIDKAILLEKIEQIKKVITPNDYALANDPEVKKIIDETINNLKTSIDGIAKDQVENKKNEIDGLKEKLANLKNEIEGLTDKDVLELDQTKKELAKQLARDMDDAGINDTKLYIRKAKLKKQASELDYPNKPNTSANRKLNRQIEDATEHNISDVENLIKGLPEKIKEAKSLINAVSSSGQDKDGKRTKDLNDQLNRAVTDDDFTNLKLNIEKAKSQNEHEYKQDLQRRLKEQVDGLNYPIPSTGGEAPAKTKLKQKIESADTATLENFNEVINNLSEKISHARTEISKLSPKDIETANTELSSASEDADFTKLENSIKSLKENENVEISTKIATLDELTHEEQEQLKKEVESANTYQDKLNVLEKARAQHLNKFIDKLPYPSDHGRAKQMLKAGVVSANKIEDNSFKTQVDNLKKLKAAIENAKKRIADLPFTENDTPGRRHLNNLLDNATEENEIQNIAPESLKNSIQKYKELITKQDDYPIPDTYQNLLLKNRLDHLPTGDENELKKQIYETKRIRSAEAVINNLSNLSAQRREQLKQAIPVWTDSDNSLTPEQLETKFNEITKKIIDAIHEDLNAKVDAIPYPDRSSAEATKAKENIKNRIKATTTKQQTNAEYSKINELIKKINELKIEASTIADQTEKNEINKLINKMEDASNADSIHLAIIRAKGKDAINNISNLDANEKNTLKEKIAQAADQAAINTIIEEGRLLSQFNLRKRQIEQVIDEIPYPDKNSSTAQASIKNLKDQVKALQNNKTDIDNLDKKVKDLKASVTTLVGKLNNIPYIKNDSSKPTVGLNKIKEKINGLTDASSASNVLDDAFITKVGKYKTIIERTYQNNNTLKNEFLKKLNEVVPDNYNGNGDYKLSQLENELLSRLKQDALSAFDGMYHLDNTRKDAHKKKINDIQIPKNLDQYQHEVVDKIDQYLVDARKENYGNFIDKLPYPSGSQYQTKVTETKNHFKNQYVNTINKQTNITNLETTLNDINTKVTNVKQAISSISASENGTAIDKFNNLFAEANDVNKLNNVHQLASNYKTNADKLNAIVDYPSDGENTTDLAAANRALNELKNTLRTKLVNANTVQAQNEVGKLIDAAVSLYTETKKFKGDILASVNFINDAKDKNSVSDINNIKNKIQPYKEQLDRFWTGDKGNELRSYKNQWFASSASKNPDNRFGTYEQLLHKLRTRNNADEVKHIVDVEVEQYKANHAFHHKYHQESNNIPKIVKDSLLELILHAPANATKAEMDEITKYLGQRQESGGSVTSGFYLDAKHLLDRIGTTGSESNKAHFKPIFDDLGKPSGGQNYDVNIRSKIDSLRRDINEFIPKLTEAKNKVAEFKNAYTDDPKATEFETKLGQVVVLNTNGNQLGANNLITEVNNYKKLLDDEKKAINDIIDNLGYPNPNSTDAMKNINDFKAKVANAKSKQALDSLKTEMTNLKNKIASFKTRITKIPYVANKTKTAIEYFNQVLNKATTAAYVDSILPSDWEERITKYKNIINDQDGILSSSDKENLLTRLNQTVPSTLTDNTTTFPVGDYKENNLVNEIISEFKKGSQNVLNNLSNLKQHNQTEYNKKVNELNSIQSGSYDSTNIDQVINKIKKITNDAFEENYNWFVDHNLNYPKESQYQNDVSQTKQRIKNHIIKGKKYKDKSSVETRLKAINNTIQSQLLPVLNAVENVSNADGGQRVKYTREFAQTDDTGLLALSEKIKEYNIAVNDLRAIHLEADKMDLKARLSASNTKDEITKIRNDITKRKADIAAAKEEAQKAVNEIPVHNDSVSRELKDKYLARLKHPDNVPLSELQLIAREAKLEKLRYEARDYLDRLIVKRISNPQDINYQIVNPVYKDFLDRLNNTATSSTPERINEIRNEIHQEFLKDKEKVLQRVRKALLEDAPKIYPSKGRNGKSSVFAEEEYFKWFEKELKKKDDFRGVYSLEVDFILGRYQQSIRIRSVIKSMIATLESARFRNKYRNLYDNSQLQRVEEYTRLIKEYAETYQFNEPSRNDKDTGFSLFDFYRTLKNYLWTHQGVEYTRINEDIRILFSLASQVRSPDTQTPPANDTNANVNDKISRSIMTKVFVQIKENMLGNNPQYTRDQAYKLINDLYSKTINTESTSTYIKLKNLKNDSTFGNLINGSGSDGFLRDAEVYDGLRLTPKNV
ncbi:GA module-containing protein [Ureaplasma canigenitalium]|uniref:GA module-containing protein n=1 Tax=Ureaplasma canigenitalium TaxID=42092 RepID=UPI0004E247B5|nr:GA module-containing protein [Ureaplasma canigenitalium]